MLIAARRLSNPDLLLRWSGRAAAVVALFALADLGARAILRLDGSWDSYAYHLPFAALRVGIPTSFDLPLQFKQMYDGFPPLGDVAEGVLWRVFGRVSGAQLANYGALVLFLAYCHVVLKARFWLVALIALTAPLVVIHATVAYIDLFANVWLAIGLSSAVSLLLFPERAPRAVLVGGLLGLVAACWTKYTLVPIAAPFFLAFIPLALRAEGSLRLGRPRILAVLALAIVVAAAPYGRNLVLFDNPFWPVRVPFVGNLFPYVSDAEAAGVAVNRPASLQDAPQWVVSARSFLEVGVPTYYAYRPRWIIDQITRTPDTDSGMRMGGFWNVGVVVFLAAMLAGLVALAGKAGRVAAAGIIATLALVAILPQANELRYVLFIPLVWAAVLGMLFPLLSARWPRGGLAFVGLVFVLFATMASVNRGYYRIQRVGWTEVAGRVGITDLWAKLTPGASYCAVGLNGTAFMMTGPTMTEYRIYSRGNVLDCPPGLPVINRDGIQPPP